MEPKSWKEFFKEKEDVDFRLHSFAGREWLKVEDLYQVFKTRMGTEQKIETIQRLLSELPTDEDREKALEDVCGFCGAMNSTKGCSCYNND